MSDPYFAIGARPFIRIFKEKINQRLDKFLKYTRENDLPARTNKE